MITLCSGRQKMTLRIQPTNGNVEMWFECYRVADVITPLLSQSSHLNAAWVQHCGNDYRGLKVGINALKTNIVQSRFCLSHNTMFNMEIACCKPVSYGPKSCQLCQIIFIYCITHRRRNTSDDFKFIRCFCKHSLKKLGNIYHYLITFLYYEQVRIVFICYLVLWLQRCLIIYHITILVE